MKRHYAGAKGIGRMSCDRLAKKLTLVTKSADSSTTERLSIDWDTFEQDQKEEFGEITFPHESTKDMPYFPENKETGTILRFTNLRREWTFERISSLRKALEKMINPFAETSAFQIEIIAPHFVEKDNAIRSKMNEIEHSAKNENEKLTALAEEEQKIVNGPIVNRMASILSLKTTQIESRLLDGLITTTLSDRGTLMYKIEEDSTYPHLEDVSINLYYLNRKAKYNFALKMGVEVVNYGNVFLFRNGFRIYPYGEPADDSWGLNKRVQQGYNRTIGTRYNPLFDEEMENVGWLRGKKLVLFACRALDFIKKYDLHTALGFGFIPTTLNDVRDGGPLHKLDIKRLTRSDLKVFTNSIVNVWKRCLTYCRLDDIRQFGELFSMYVNVEIVDVLINHRDIPHYRTVADMLYYLYVDMNYVE